MAGEGKACERQKEKHVMTSTEEREGLLINGSIRQTTRTHRAIIAASVFAAVVIILVAIFFIVAAIEPSIVEGTPFAALYGRDNGKE
ncbi:hypothetical protein niasHT_037918 [Heterodera trifolii]|uniref:Uncharacterized protein n=1 Tax=Heterodera trifolii TaxID=157864 RepID=A0ABD2HVW3_9BILA